MRVYLDFEHLPLEFSSPETVISCHCPEHIPAAFAEIEDGLRRGYYAAGFLSYEAGCAFETRLRPRPRYDFPLLMIGLYARPRCRRLERPHDAGGRGRSVRDHRLNISRSAYERRIAAIRNLIAAGIVYQITYCVKLRFRPACDPRLLYWRLLERQPVPYPAYIDTGRYQIVSLSPERFFKKTGRHLLTEPMKGTWQRGQTPAEDAVCRRRFQADPKNRAENLMICDLLRNDLGRIGSQVAVPALYTVTPYNTLFQMTSTVTARVRPDLSAYALFAALFPSGSVTGAPKIRAMQEIQYLEGEDRRIYTGAIGYIAPDRTMYFNVPIRTLLLEGDKGELGIGGGIVWDSTPQGEWEEGLLKASFLL